MNPDLTALVRCHLEAENAHDLPGTPATLHPDCRFEDFATGQSWQDHAGAAAHYGQLSPSSRAERSEVEGPVHGSGRA